MSQLQFDPTVGCPLCGGEVRYNKKERGYQCQYCRRVFPAMMQSEADAHEDISEDKSGNKKSDKDPFSTLNPAFFEVNVKYNELKPRTRESVEHFCRYNNRYNTAAQMHEQIKKEYSWDKDMAMPGHNEELLAKVRPLIEPQLQPGEEILLYVDDGLLFRGKSGFLITNLRTFFHHKKWKTFTFHKDISSIEISEVFWELNTVVDTALSTVGASHEFQGACAALVCALCFEQDPEHDPIRLLPND